MSKHSGLVPTVITNKNGVLTVVHRRPGKKTPPSRAYVPAAADADRDFYLLKKELSVLIEDPSTDNMDYLWRNRAFSGAVAAHDLTTLERMKTHFNSKGGNFRETVDIIEKIGLDRTDHALFALVINFIDLAKNSRQRAEQMIPFVHLLLERPEDAERIAHQMNLASNRDKDVSPEEITAILDQPPGKTVVPAHLAEALSPANTPVSDRRLVYSSISNQLDWYAYTYFTDFDDQTMAYLATAIRSNVLRPGLAKMIKSENMNARTAVEFTALLTSVADLLDTFTVSTDNDRRWETREFLHAPNGEFISNVFKRLWSFSPYAHYYSDEQTPASLPIDDEAGFAVHSALFRFLLTINARHYEESIGWQTSNARHADSSDVKLLNLLSRRNSRQEITMLVNFFNERGMLDATAAETYLEENQSPALIAGWL